MPSKKPLPPERLFLVVIMFLLSYTLFKTGISVYVDYLWFDTLGYTSVFMTILRTKIFLGVITALLFFLFASGNFWLASKHMKRRKITIVREVKHAVFGVILLLSVFIGLFGANGWQSLLRFRNAANFGVLDPIFLKDVGFYVLQLPFLEFSFWTAWISLLLVSIIVVAFYGFLSMRQKTVETTGATYVQFDRSLFFKEGWKHFSALGAVFFFLLALRYAIAKYHLLFSTRGVAVGASYTDLTIQLPVLRVLFFISIGIGVLFLVSARLNLQRFTRTIILAFLAIAIVGGMVLPGLVQQYRVMPNELRLERPYIEYNIQHTSQAFGLNQIEEENYEIQYDLSLEDLDAHQETLDNIRLWDWRPLKTTYTQLQEIRLYYKFNDVDLDRYTINGKYSQVELSARELSQEELPESGKTWLNQHLVYTHGHGVAMSPVNKVTADGLPEFYVKDIPASSDLFEITRPEIYYGELTTNYVLANTKENELDYPVGDQNVYTKYAGAGGVPIDSFARKILFALYFKDVNILLTSATTPETRILMNRQIQRRVKVLAPFLEYDHDPYVVLENGRLYWIQDAYTTSSNYPYSERVGGVNYIRNAVKVVVDAYNGDVSFYVWDQDDPIIETYATIFPELFKSSEEFPEALKAHVRYPEDLFLIQSEMYRNYHMKDVQVFYNKEDAWDIPREIIASGQEEMEPYYVIMRLPGEMKEEFVLMRPYTPRGKNNMIAWFAARSDGEDYGTLKTYKFQKEELIYGPMQIEALIDQDSEISEQLTLWGQRGSSVIRGNLLMIPIRNNILAVEPLYLLADQGELPELKKVFVSYNANVVMADTLEEGLEKIFGDRTTEIISIVRDEGQDQTELIKEAAGRYDKANERLRAGDLAGFERELDALGKALNELAEE